MYPCSSSVAAFLNPTVGYRACEEIRREIPYAKVDWLECDLGNLRCSFRIVGLMSAMKALPLALPLLPPPSAAYSIVHHKKH